MRTILVCALGGAGLAGCIPPAPEQLSGAAVHGHVFDEVDKSAVPGVFVWIVWDGLPRSGNRRTSERLCYHVEVVRSDRNGNYASKAWIQENPNGIEPRNAYVFAYKPGYAQSDERLIDDVRTKYQSEHQPFHPDIGVHDLFGADVHRIDALRALRLTCQGAASESMLFELTRSVYEEAKQVAGAGNSTVLRLRDLMQRQGQQGPR